MQTIEKPCFLDDTGKRIASAVENYAEIKYGARVGWADIPDEDIPKVISLADRGIIDLYSDLGWTAGDERKMTISIPKTVDDAVVYTDYYVNAIITDPGHFSLATPTRYNKNTCNFVVVFDGILSEGMDYTRAYVWGSVTNIHTYLSDTVLPALPSGLREVLKMFTVQTDKSGGLYTENILITLPSSKEVTNVAYAGTYGNGLSVGDTQLDYYKVSYHRVKKDKSNIPIKYWTRTIDWAQFGQDTNTWRAVAIDGSGANSATTMNTACYISPIVCI